VIGQIATILIVDDQPTNRRVLEALLAPEGYTTLSVGSGQEALDLIAGRAPDLILLDVMMPGIDGHEVARRLKADPSTSSIPIIMVTAVIGREARLAALAAGAEEFLTLPVDRAELWLRVRNLLRLKAFTDFTRDHGVILEKQVRARTADLQRFRTAIDATGDAIFLIDQETQQFVEVNETACTMLGYTREEFFATEPYELRAGSTEQVRGIAETMSDGHAEQRLAEIDLLRHDGLLIQVEVNRMAHQFGDSWVVVAVARDITERKKVELRLHQLAHFDVLTGLPNRALFYSSLRSALLLARERMGQLAVLFLDLDNFKNVNDTLGHAAGDELLVQCGRRLSACMPNHCSLGRLGGDELAIILEAEHAQASAIELAKRIRETLSTPFVVNGRHVLSTASVGIALYPADAASAETLLQYADMAMYRAKHGGRDTYRLFTPQMSADALAKLELEMALRDAVEHGEFLVHYQPKVRLDTGRIAGVEALLRWHRPGHGMVMPSVFIPVLEESGLIVRVAQWTLLNVCRQIRQWRESGAGDVQVAVNIAQRQFIEGDLEADVDAALTSNHVPGRLLELELTESSMMANTAHTVSVLQGLRDRGVKISVDDFGTGYSSLAYLGRLPIDKLKIDIAFIRNITTSPDDAAITLAIIGLAHSLKLEVIAEGVETIEQLAYLQGHGCDQIQGYYFSRPLPLDALNVLMESGRGLPPMLPAPVGAADLIGL
jgi:diguanylate cyclase (GGDEF)-like protein/PAS domain S-box-containing protein